MSEDDDRHVYFGGPEGGLVDRDEVPVVTIRNGGGTSEALLVADHAGRAIPRKLGTLGLTDAQRSLHIACDIGIGMVTYGLSHLLDAPAVLAGYSRLVMDLNREPGGFGSFVEASDGIEIPGNRGLTEDDRRLRKAALFDPYHLAITALIETRKQLKRKTALICLHSFTPEIDGFKRPWHIGVLWNGTFGGIAERLLKSLRTEPGLCIGDNEPYDARGDVGYTQRHHAVPVGMPNVLIEIRQDLIADEDGQGACANLLAKHFGPILMDESLWAEAGILK
ncbi:MAG: N-formylglutamate amidohydrolase [Dongiaceae bacterium]